MDKGPDSHLGPRWPPGGKERLTPQGPAGPKGTPHGLAGHGPTHSGLVSDGVSWTGGLCALISAEEPPHPLLGLPDSQEGDLLGAWGLWGMPDTPCPQVGTPKLYVEARFPR